MKLPTIELNGKKLILLSGARNDKDTGKTVALESLEQLLATVRQNPDAVAFGYTSGRWFAGA